MTEPDSRSPRTFPVVVYGLALGVAVLGLVARVVSAHDEGNSWLDVMGMLLIIGAGIVVLLFALSEMFAWLDRVRTRALRRLYPTAFIAEVATDSTLVSQADAFSMQSTGKRTRLRPSAYVSIVADREAVRFFRGSHNPRQVAAFRSAAVRRVELGSSQSGARMVPCLDIVFEDGTAHGRLSVHLMRFGRVLPGFVRNDSLADAVRGFRTASGVE
ncbi:hypothetical protein G3T36_02410 [Diaminobutyricibacter tongyongensis]|uniref:Uncharacterized protein n=1 Tax=Leifsonia tongyongensis TaxID=1268043 RepID=A0A6L9XTL4_9MICO|nr:hypothetical protein [Diaminobutyricibacter tongyongensis]NEN04713.1 hypothetical protein [Diaminobutyricibacter tongyongensis]